MKNKKEIEIVIKKDGTFTIDQIGYEGKGCSGDVEDIIKQLGKKVKTKKKSEYLTEEKVKINQKHI